MATPRTTRKSSRHRTPDVSASNEAIALDLGSHLPAVKSGPVEEWAEPALRNQTQSFEDRRGSERLGALDQAAPLGTMSGQTVKLRVKQWDPNRLSSGRNGDTHAVRGSSRGQDTPNTTRRLESKNVENVATRTQSNRELGEHEEVIAKGRQDDDPIPVTKTPATRNPLTPIAKIVGQEHLRQVVDSAIKRARGLGNDVLGLALERLFEESLQNRTLANLLDAVLSQTQSKRQAHDFQAYIRSAKKQIKMESSTTSHSSNPGTAAESTQDPKTRLKASRRSRSRNMSPQPDKASRAIASPTPAKRSINGTLTDGAMEQSEPPPKRAKRSDSASSTSSLSSTHSLDIEAGDMAVIDEPISTLAGPKSRGNNGIKVNGLTGRHGTKRAAGALSGPGNKGDIDDTAIAELAVKKRRLIKPLDGVKIDETSSVRPPPVPTKRRFPAPELANSHRLVRTSDQDDIRSPVSSAQGEFLVPPPPGAMRTSRSRGATPNALGRPRNAAKRSARVKMSPMKKKTAVTAGVARITRAREQDVEQTDGADGDNADYCSACGGSGELLCCDGCTRSFHFRCLDPQIDPQQPPEGEWYCYSCEAKRGPPTKSARGLLSGVQQHLHKQNPVAFSLTTSLREYFEGVRTGEEGEYEDVSTAKNRNHKLIPGYDEAHNDNFKIKDAKNNIILCFKCGKSALGRREIISCDYCSLKWHLDCLDPPMANPPIRDHPNRPKHGWMCPAHTEQELLTVGHCGRVHKVRRPKNAKIVDTTLRRGFRNNGIIEIENDPSDVEDFVGTEDSVIFRVSEKGLKLDFIDRVKRLNAQAEERREREARVAGRKAVEEEAHAKEQRLAFINRPIMTQQAALALKDFRHQSNDETLDADQLQALVHGLISEAPQKVVAMATMDDGKTSSQESSMEATRSGDAKSPPSVPPTPPTTESRGRSLDPQDRKHLLVLQELIRQRLAEAQGA